MCGRYSFVPTRKQLENRQLELPETFTPRYNIAPSQQAFVLVSDGASVLFRQMIWGLIPAWNTDGANSGKLINARSESIFEKPSFRDAALRRHCLVPADSFYEWRTLPGKRKVPYRIRLKDGNLLLMAGLWEEWKHGTEQKQSFTILTTAPNAEIASLHDRMPVILSSAETQQRWLETTDPQEIQRILRELPDGSLELYRVSEKLNMPGQEGPELHEPVGETDPTLF